MTNRTVSQLTSPRVYGLCLRAPPVLRRPVPDLSSHACEIASVFFFLVRTNHVFGANLTRKCRCIYISSKRSYSWSKVETCSHSTCIRLSRAKQVHFPLSRSASVSPAGPCLDALPSPLLPSDLGTKPIRTLTSPRMPTAHKPRTGGWDRRPTPHLRPTFSSHKRPYTGIVIHTRIALLHVRSA